AGLGEVLARGGFTVDVVPTGEEALARLTPGAVDLIVTDLRLPGIGGLDVLREVRRTSPGTAAIVITAHGTIEDAVAAMKLGAFDFLTKPFSPADLLHLAGRAGAGGASGAPVSGGGAPDGRAGAGRATATDAP